VSLVVVAGLVLPAAVYVLALALPACREWAGISVLPRARCVARSVRRLLAGEPTDQAAVRDRRGAADTGYARGRSLGSDVSVSRPRLKAV
jgi:hypothetical protein